MSRIEQVQDEMFHKAVDKLGDAQFAGRPYLVISQLTSPTMFSFHASNGRRGMVPVLLRAMEASEFIKDIILDAAKVYNTGALHELQGPYPTDVAEIVMNKPKIK